MLGTGKIDLGFEYGFGTSRPVAGILTYQSGAGSVAIGYFDVLPTENLAFVGMVPRRPT